MPWSKTSAMDQKHLFIRDYVRGSFAMAELCRRYGISRPTGYKWVERFEAEGLLAVCVQHEIDHLDGKLFVDYLSQLKRQRIRKKANKQQRQVM